MMKTLFGKRTWIGLGASVCLMTILLLLGALLTVRGIYPQDRMLLWICGAYVLSALIGGLLASAGKVPPICGLLPALLLYLLVWVLSLSCSGEIDFAAGGIPITAAILSGGGVSLLLRSRKGKGRGKKQKRRAAIHAVRR